MKYMAESNALLTRFEEILLNGKAMKPIEINKWSVVRTIKLGDQGIVLVSDYSKYEPEEKFVQFSSDEISGYWLMLKLVRR